MAVTVQTLISGSVDQEYSDSLFLLPGIRQIISDNPIQTGDRLLRLQVNAGLKSTRHNVKPDASYVNGKVNKDAKNGSKWVTLDNANIPILKSLITEGFILRFGVKLNGTSYRENFVSADAVYWDIDINWTIEQSINELALIPKTLIYGTPNYTPENQKHRIISVLNRTVDDPKLIQAIYKYYLGIYTQFDQACSDPARIMYGSLGNIFHQDYNALLDVDELLEIPQFSEIYKQLIAESAVDKALKKPSKTPQESLTDRYHKILYGCLVEDFRGNLNDFLAKLGLEFPFKFTEVSPDDKSIERKWVGANPFSQTNSSGTSLVCSYKDNKLLFYDRANGNGVSLIDFIDCYRNDSLFLFQSVSNAEFHKILQEVSTALEISLADIYAIGKIDFTQVLERWIFPYLGDNCRYVNLPTKACWIVYNGYKWNIVGKEFICNLFSSVYRKIFNKPMSSGHSLQMNYGFSFPEELTLESLPPQDLKYFSFKNGFYNIQTKELEDLTPKWNYSDPVYDYFPSDGKGIELLRSALQESGLADSDRDIIEKAIILICQQKFHHCMKWLYFYGKTTSGKSALSRVINRLMNLNDSGILDSSNVTKNITYFSSMLQPVTVLDEIQNPPKDLLIELMSLIRSANANGLNYQYRKMYSAPVPINRYHVLIMTGEYLDVGRTTNLEGYLERIIPIQFNQKISRYDSYWRQLLSSPEHLQDLLCWALEQPTNDEDMIRELATIQCSSDLIKTRLSELAVLSDPFKDFILRFESDDSYRGNKEDRHNSIFIPNTHLQTIYTQVTGDAITHSHKWQTIAAKLARAFKELNPHAESVVSKKFGRGWYGVKFIDSDSQDDTLEDENSAMIDELP